jgi:hypothetical protein
MILSMQSTSITTSFRSVKRKLSFNKNIPKKCNYQDGELQGGGRDRRTSSLMSSVSGSFFVSKKDVQNDEPNKFENSEASSSLTAGELIVSLELAVCNPQFRKDLVDILLANHSTGAREVRFIHAVIEVQRQEGTHRLFLEKKIIQMFFSEHSFYRLPDVPLTVERKLFESKSRNIHKNLLIVKLVFIKSLLANPLVLEQLNQFYGNPQINDDGIGRRLTASQ